MNEAIKTILKTYGPLRNQGEEINALKEIIQLVSLLGLQRGGFFDKGCFYGGTALRILFGLDRFSEDMDFCLLERDSAFKLQPYFEAIQEELERYGFSSDIQEKRTGTEVDIESAFVKQNTSMGLIVIGGDNKQIPKGQLVKIKLEVDKMNPDGFEVSKKLIKLPVPFMVSTLTEGSLFAGKLHALIARAYVERVKGRDYYDFLFYMARDTKVNIQYLESKLRDSGHYMDSEPLNRSTIIELLINKFRSVDLDKAKKDVQPFLGPHQVNDLSYWSTDLFVSMAEQLSVD